MTAADGMTVAAWTPGPWEIGDDDHNGQAIVRGKHIEIATCWHHSVTSIEMEMRANARLIAAAPDLYEALNILVENDGQLSFEEHGLAMQTARAALAKATTQE